MYSHLDSGPKAYPENTVGDGQELLSRDGIGATWHNVQLIDRQIDRQVTCHNSILFAKLLVGIHSFSQRSGSHVVWIK